MHRFSICLLLLLGVTALHAAPAAKSASFGSHGMVLFGGKDGLFASHLPMFHAPHDAQVILQISLSDAALERAMRIELEAHPQLWSIDPEAFSLAELYSPKQPLTQFRAQLVQGHFERGGKLRYQDVQIQVQKVLFHAQLKPKPQFQPTLSYQIVQLGHTAFLFKHIERRPDFDHIVRLKTTQTALDARVLQLPANAQHAPTSESLQSMLLKAQIAANVAQTIYLDDADLQ